MASLRRFALNQFQLKLVESDPNKLSAHNCEPGRWFINSTIFIKHGSSGKYAGNGQAGDERKGQGNNMHTNLQGGRVVAPKEGWNGSEAGASPHRTKMGEVGI